MIQPIFQTQNSPIAVFDSGIGGLSVFQALISALPNENWIYFADSANAPYGEKSPDFILQRCLTITNFLLQQHQIKMLIVACNTATAVTIAELRQQQPDLLIIGLEPAIKPAMQLSKTKQIAVAATERTIDSEKFNKLLQQVRPSGTVKTQAFNGLAGAIEQLITSPQPSQQLTQLQNINELIELNLAMLSPFTHTKNSSDILVLGCTHYPLVVKLFKQLLPAKIICIDSAEFIVKRCYQLLDENNLANNGTKSKQQHFYTTADTEKLQLAANFVLNQQNSIVKNQLTKVLI